MRGGCGAVDQKRLGGPADAGAMNRLNGIVASVGYLGGASVYTITLDSGATLHASLANTARLDADAYAVGERVVAWFAPDDCIVLGR